MKTSEVLNVIFILIGSFLISKTCANPKCPEGWELFNNTKCITILRNATNSFQSEDACSKSGGQRWVYHTDIESEFVLDLFKLNFPDKRFIYLWIGITLDDDRNYRWDDGQLANDVADVNAACPKTDVCPVKIFQRDLKESLVCSFACTLVDAYPLCQKLLEPPTIPPQPIGEEEEKEETVTPCTTTERPRIYLPQSPLCEEGWDYFDNHCYHLTPTKHNGGADARGACTMRGSDVVSVTSFDQQKFFETIIFYKDHGLAGNHYEGPAFLGARKVGNNSFAWESGQQLNFTYWAPNEPSEGNCIIISRLSGLKGKWRTIRCTSSQRVLCGKPTKLGVTTVSTTEFVDLIERHSDDDMNTEEYDGIETEEIISGTKSMEQSNAEQKTEPTKSPVQNASLMICIVVIILLAILFLICFVLRVRRKAKERNREKLHLEQTNGDSKTYVSKP